MVDGQAMVMMMAMISSNSPSRQGARTEFLVLFHGIWWWRRSGTPSGKTSTPPRSFSVRRLLIGEEGDRGGAWGAHTMPWRGQAQPAPSVCGQALALLRLVFWLRESSEKIGTSAFVPSNSENIHFLTFLEPKTAENRQLALWLLLIG